MKEAMLILCVLAVFAFGYFMMRRLDKLLNHSTKENEEHAEESWQEKE